MTAEIAVMNKNAIALAADSAVTISGGNSRKIFNTANKLFTLSKYQPVGIMFYGKVLLTGVPWEVIVKSYRSKLDKKSFDTLEEYADNFFNFLKENIDWFDSKNQIYHLSGDISNLFKGLVGESTKKLTGR